MLQNLTVAGITLSTYDLFDTLAGFTMLFYILLQTGKYREYLPAAISGQRKRTAVSFLYLLIMSLVFYRTLLTINGAFADWFTNGNGNYYGNLTAYFMVMTLFSIIFRVSPLKTMDLLSPGLPLSLFVAKLACFFHGCCSGFEMSESWYFNQYTGRYEFPVQMIESLVALALYVFLRWHQRRNNIPGSVFPVCLILYSASRFMTEFLRADLANVLGPFDAYQVMSIVYVFLGICLLRLVWIHHRRISHESEEADLACR